MLSTSPCSCSQVKEKSKRSVGLLAGFTKDLIISSSREWRTIVSDSIFGQNEVHDFRQTGYYLNNEMWMRWTFLILVLCCYLPICINGHPPSTSRLDLIHRGARIPLPVRRSVLLPGKHLLSMLTKDKGTAEPAKNEDSATTNVRERKKSYVSLTDERKTLFDVDNPIFTSQNQPRRKNLFVYKMQTTVNTIEKYRNLIHTGKKKDFEFLNAESESNLVDSSTESSEKSNNSEPTKELEENRVNSDLLIDLFNERTETETVSTTTIISPEETTEENIITTVFDQDYPKSQPKIIEPDKIISVRVSSSVGTSIKAQNSSETEDFRLTPNVTLVTETEPVVTALQRSRFDVEESVPEIASVKQHELSPDSHVKFLENYESVNKTNQNLTKRSDIEEKYELETRVETVSYHQEVILNQNRNQLGQFSTQNLTNSESYGIKRQPNHNYEMPERVYGLPEDNYEIEESVSVMSNGRVHGIRGQISTESPDSKKDKNKFGYVVEGRDFRKYRIEERTADGFIVGEYGVFRHDDGSLRGVRYTADSTTNPRLIYDALVKFLSL